MTVHDLTIAKIKALPEPLAQKVSDFIDFLLLKQNTNNGEKWLQENETLTLSESDMSDYLHNLNDYEEKLLQGEIKW